MNREDLRVIDPADLYGGTRRIADEELEEMGYIPKNKAWLWCNQEHASSHWT